MRYSDIAIGLQEVPDEISICVNILGCPNHCEGCHSPHLWDTSNLEGIELNETELAKIVKRHDKASCFCFLGGDWSPKRLQELLYWLKVNTNLKLALYSGKDLDYFLTYPEIDLSLLDYLKVGKYIKTLGGLYSQVTNQIMYKLDKGKIVAELTAVFQK